MLFSTIVFGALFCVALLIVSIAAPRFRVWPLPDRGGPGWRTRRALNRSSGVAVSALSLAVLLLGLLERGTFSTSPALVVLGSLLAAAGAVLGLLGYSTLGPAQSLGESGALVSNGPYRVSRNPQYVGAAALLVGFSVALGSGPAFFASLACSSWYLVAPFAEEPWLRAKLGSGYAAYLESAPRFIGLPRKGPAA